MPYMLVVGARTAEQGRVTARKRSGKDPRAMSLEAAEALLNEQVARRG